LLVELEHLKIKTMLIDEMFASVTDGEDARALSKSPAPDEPAVAEAAAAASSIPLPLSKNNFFSRAPKGVDE
jgi:hypothetical protein